ncbi:hypothetical protein BJP34_20165 [Moorena producens PAL-8-15-08-1]|uniref:Uncharacterized protein n=1 Tax=Moorena producens PAL-8-15-08-1 TaxID=1458985 RepID=A0A1D8TUX2_9CYAN|nr:hypothetical protein BJP34_20165 [Moorena producens PAL-8-15-08-1]
MVISAIATSACALSFVNSCQPPIIKDCWQIPSKVVETQQDIAGWGNSITNLTAFQESITMAV